MRTTPHYDRVRELMTKAGQQFPKNVTVPLPEVRLLRARLIFEEAMETIQALGVDVLVQYPSLSRELLPVGKKAVLQLNPTREPDLIEVADGCADISVVTIGTLIACGIPDVPLLELVDQSNLAKFTGDGHCCPDTGKWIKPSDWQPPDIEALLADLSLGVDDATE